MGSKPPSLFAGTSFTLAKVTGWMEAFVSAFCRRPWSYALMGLLSLVHCLNKERSSLSVRSPSSFMAALAFVMILSGSDSPLPVSPPPPLLPTPPPLPSSSSAVELGLVMGILGSMDTWTTLDERSLADWVGSNGSPINKE